MDRAENKHSFFVFRVKRRVQIKSCKRINEKRDRRILTVCTPYKRDICARNHRRLFLARYQAQHVVVNQLVFCTKTFSCLPQQR